MTSVLALGGQLRTRLAATMADRRRWAEVLVAVAVVVTLGHAVFALTKADNDLTSVERLRQLASMPALLAGLLLLYIRPTSRIGWLLALFSLLAFIPHLTSSRIPVIYTLAQGYNFSIPVLLFLLLAHPHGRLSDLASKLVVGATAIVAVVFDVGNALFADPARSGCGDCPPGINLALIEHRPGVQQWLIDWVGRLGLSLGVLAAILVFVHFIRGTRPARRALLPILPYALVLMVGSIVQIVVLSLLDLDRLNKVAGRIGTVQEVALLLLPIGIAFGVLRNTKRRQVRISDLVVALTDVPSADRLQAAVARALGDPSVQVGVWRPEVALYVGSDGMPLDPPVRGSGLDATYLARENGPLAVVVHDEALLDDPGTLASVTAAVRLAVENDRLQEELLEQLREVEASRLRIVEAAYAERRRLERDLHDGAQQRLVSTALALRMARSTASDPAVDAQLAAAGDELAAAIAELRDLARGMYPAVLSDEGLPAALQSLADRCPVPTRLDAVPDRRLPAAVEAAAYFVVAEALTNVAKYADASTADISAAVDGGWLVITVIDNGNGGAHLSPGGGLAGLRDRLAAFDGTLELTSPRGAGTTLTVRLPAPSAGTATSRHDIGSNASLEVRA